MEHSAMIFVAGKSSGKKNRKASVFPDRAGRCGADLRALISLTHCAMLTVLGMRTI